MKNKKETNKQPKLCNSLSTIPEGIFDNMDITTLIALSGMNESQANLLYNYPLIGMPAIIDTKIIKQFKN